MNPDLKRLQPYPFEKLNRLKDGVTPAAKPPIALSIGEPKHQPPGFVVEELITHLHGLSSYPLTRGSDALRRAIAGWLTRRFALPEGSIDAEQHVLPVAGTREALFAFAQAVVDRTANGSGDPLVLCPNPFYQIYEGAALLAGAVPWFMNTGPENGFLPDLEAVPDAVWQRCQLIYLCSPGNPTGAVADIDTLQRLIRLADEHDFIIASDECYSELYFDVPPPGLLQAAAQMGRTGYERCVVFHSLSKRSNLPGLRSGFVAGDAAVLAAFLKYRTYHGCALPPHTQAASSAAWGDEAHVATNRERYRQKFDAVLAILQPVMAVERPDAGFYLWAKSAPLSDTEFAKQLFAQQNVTVLPGSYLSREAHGINPGSGRVRMALVAELDECIEAARRIRDFITSL
ncbi:MAG: succinyldiaminopimelate transaminase [Gammaproteobacteria bacterium]|nr:succinyldiaminopimelate transaminase [Gammaproteobacteria bacterium]